MTVFTTFYHKFTADKARDYENVLQKICFIVFKNHFKLKIIEKEISNSFNILFDIDDGFDEKCFTEEKVPQEWKKEWQEWKNKGDFYKEIFTLRYSE